MAKAVSEKVPFGVVGGSGLYGLSDLQEAGEFEIETPYGPPSDLFRVGRLGSTRVAFLARHGRHHHLLPGEINYRANLWAFKQLGVERLIAASAVGSLRESIEPRHVVTVDQFIDRTRKRNATFFGEGLVAHVALADPVCADLRGQLSLAARDQGATVHERGVYVCMEGPAFSTRAESELFRSWGADVIGMTNLQEAALAREAEICYATLALVTDFDCWHEEEDDVTVAALLANLEANAGLAGATITQVLGDLAAQPRSCACGRALQDAVFTPLDRVPQGTLTRLAPILARYRSDRGC
jgi:5'-methylthioadenosine phosphorylase